jgi:hypothetical protein
MRLITKSILGNVKLALAFCLVGRALDFATTWVALWLGCASEAKPGPAQFIQSAGPWLGLIIWEFAITTPFIFLGCKLAKRTVPPHWSARACDTTGSMSTAAIPLLYFVGIVSIIVGIHNYGYIF